MSLNKLIQGQLAVCVLLVLCILLLVTCQKEGELRLAPEVTEARIKVISPREGARFAVFVDDVKVGDSLKTNIELTKIVAKKNGGQHLVIRELTNNATLVDTNLILASPSFSVSVLEFDTTAGARPLLFTGGGSSEIAADSAKLAFYLGDTAVPAPVDIYLYKSNAYLDTLDTVPVHVFRDVKIFSATNFVTIDMSSDSVRYNILVKKAGTDELVPDIRNNTGVIPDNSRSGIVTNVCIRHGDPNGMPSNIHNIVRLRKLGSFYRVNCMIYFE